jgi:hypothetical protein
MTTDIEDLILIKNELIELNEEERKNFNSLEFIKKIKKNLIQFSISLK